MNTVITIAGFDPSSGAGITADLMVFAAHGLFGAAAITALTVQSTQGVRASHPVDSSILRDTLLCLNADMPPVGIKIGMAGHAANIRAISHYIETLSVSDSLLASRIVLDPVFVASSGHNLLDAEAIAMLQQELLPLVGWITPNAGELASLTGLTVRSTADLAAAARTLQERTPAGRIGSPIGVFAKGGHLDKPDDLLLTPDGAEHWLAGDRIDSTATHGTGCALSSAFLCRLVLGENPVAAARGAKEYVAEAMRRAPDIGRGKGPMNLLWPLRSLQSR